MSKVIPTAYTQPRPLTYAAGKPIIASDWADLAQQGHHIYQRIGARVPLYSTAGTDANGAFETTSASYTSIDDNDATRPLTLFTGVFRLTREMLDSSAVKHQLVLVGVGSYIDLQATVYAVDTGTSLGTITASTSSSSSVRFESSLLLTKAQADAGGVSGSAPRILGVSIQAKVNTGATAHLYHAMLYESYITGAQLPDGT